MKEKHYLTPLLEPRSVGIIGASEREASLGSVLMRNMLEAGYKGKLFAINRSTRRCTGSPATSRWKTCRSAWTWW